MSAGGFVPTESFSKPRVNRARYRSCLIALISRVFAAGFCFIVFGLADGTAGVRSIDKIANDI